MAGVTIVLMTSRWAGGVSRTFLHRNCVYNPRYQSATKVSAFLLTDAIKRAVWTRFIKAQSSLTVSLLATTGVPASSTFCNQRRWLSTTVKRNQRQTDVDGTRGNPYHLMNFPEIMWPSVFKSIKNYIFTFLVVKPYLDNDFTLNEFMNGSKHAFVHVSKLLSEGDFEGLKGLITDEAIMEIKRNFEKMAVKDRLQLAFQSSDVYFAFPYQLGIMFDENTQPQKRYAEITVCFHCFHGFDEIRKRDPNLGSMYEHRDSIVVCNYRFIREYTKGIEDNWIINKLNHFKPVVV